MSRVKTGFTRRRRHQKILTANQGFRGTNRRLYKRAHEARLHAGHYAYVGRRLRKRDFRRLWITRIGIALRQIDQNLLYSRFIKALSTAHITLDRKILADLAATNFDGFKSVVKTAGLI